MKVFAFDPTTGTRGEQIGNVERNSWAAEGVDFCFNEGHMKRFEYKLPKGRKDERWTAHVDAGVSDREGKMISYLSEDKWVCFCTGQWQCGEESAVWEWVVLPPKSLLDKSWKTTPAQPRKGSLDELI